MESSVEQTIMGIPIIGGGPPLIEGDDKKRATSCNQEVQVLLKKYGCIIVPQFVITGTDVTAGWLMAALPRSVPPPPGKSDN